MPYKLKRRGCGSVEEIISDLQRVSRLHGRLSVTQRDYEEDGGFSVNRVVQMCGNWNKALKMANCKISRPTWTRVDCLRGIRAVWDKLGRQPRFIEYKKMAPELGFPCVSAVELHLKTWSQALLAFRDSMDAASPVEEANGNQQSLAIPSTSSGAARRRSHACGEPIGSDGMSFAPINEIGVVALFGILTGELGFIIECIGTVFPDCRAMRKDSRTGRYMPVLIEFEFKSSNFLKHKHESAGCTLLVCWEHDWNKCPSTIEILSLKNYLRERRGQHGAKTDSEGPPAGLSRYR